MNSAGNNQTLRDSNPGLFKTPELSVTSSQLNLCHVGLVITDAAFSGYDGYKELVDLFLTYEDNFLLVGHIGASNEDFNSLSNVISKDKGLAIKIDDMNNIFLCGKK